MTNQVGIGDPIQIVAPGGGVVSGTPYQVGGLFGIPIASASAGAQVALALSGEFELPITSEAVAVGDVVYWSTNVVTKTVTGRPIGIVTEARADTATTCKVNINTAVEPQVADATLSALAGTGASQGASLVGIRDVGTLYTAETVEAALAEVKAIADAACVRAKIVQVAATVVSGQSVITTAAVAANIGAAIIGWYANTNQDQLIDKIEVTATGETKVTLAAAATADNTFMVTLLRA